MNNQHVTKLTQALLQTTAITASIFTLMACSQNEIDAAAEGPKDQASKNLDTQPAMEQAAVAAPAPMEFRDFKMMSSSAFASHPAMTRTLEPPMQPPGYQEVGRDEFETVAENPVRVTAESPISTFAIDVDTASYSFVRRQLNQGQLPQKAAVRIEEMLNYFDYQYSLPENSEQPFNTQVSVQDSPWKPGNKLLHIGIKGYDIATNKQPRANLVFLLDVSGSMNAPDKLPLLKQSMELLVNQLHPKDTIAMVVYAGAAGTVLEPTPVKEKSKILAALTQLEAGGSTAGGAGIQLAYQLAQQHFDKHAVNRIILATDGDFNVGITDREELQGFVERQRKQGIYLSIFGFGQGNYNDRLMQQLAQNGNGIAAYIDTLSEAQKILIHEASANLFPIADDLKVQVEFNPATVQEYRLIGYETRALNKEDFNNDKVDAGDIGAGHSVTAIYEFTPVGATSLNDSPRYSANKTTAATKSSDEDEYAFVKLRYKLPGEQESRLLTQPVPRKTKDLNKQQQQEVNFAIAVAGFAQLLKDSKFVGQWDYDQVITLAQANKGADPYGYRTEFVQLVRKAKIAKAL